MAPAAQAARPAPEMLRPAVMETAGREVAHSVSPQEELGPLAAVSVAAAAVLAAVAAAGAASEVAPAVVAPIPVAALKVVVGALAAPPGRQEPFSMWE